MPGTYSFWDLHVAIQDSMGWLDYHLLCFRIARPGMDDVMQIGELSRIRRTQPSKRTNLRHDNRGGQCVVRRLALAPIRAPNLRTRLVSA